MFDANSISPVSISPTSIQFWNLGGDPGTALKNGVDNQGLTRLETAQLLRAGTISETPVLVSVEIATVVRVLSLTDAPVLISVEIAQVVKSAALTDRSDLTVLGAVEQATIVRQEAREAFDILFLTANQSFPTWVPDLPKADTWTKDPSL